VLRITMDDLTLGIAFTVILLGLILLIRMPIGFSMALAGAMGIYFIAGSKTLFNIISHTPFTTAHNYVFTVIPMFVLMGWLAAESGISTDLFIAMNKWLGWMKGGLAMAVSLACAGFGAVCGCSITTAVTMTAIALPEMRRHNYSDQLSTGILCAGGNLGFLIPPSIGFIIFGIITETSIGHLFMAGIIPGVILALLFCVAIYVICRIDPKAGPASPRLSLREMVKLPMGAWLMLLLAIIVLGGIYAGLFTPTEAGGAGAFATFVFGLAAKRLPWNGFVRALVNTVKTSGMIFILIIGAMIFSAMLALSTLPFALVDIIEGFSVNRYFVLVAILVVFIILGFFLDIMSIMLILLPVVFPVTEALGFDAVWFGVLTIITVLMGQISPPVGIVVYSVSGMVRDVPVMTIFRGAMPFFFVMALSLVLFIAFPQISLLLPDLMTPAG
jgi:C4-dicarboxylate transporter DctM subunit